MATPRFDLVDVVHTIRKQRRFIITVTLIAAILGGVSHFVKKKKYEAQTEFIVTNPLYGDRSNIYGDTHFLDYFGDEDNIDRVISIAESDTVASKVVREMHLAEAYNIDTTDPRQVFKLKSIFQSSLNIKRTEYKDVKLLYTDTDPKRAADIANVSARVIEGAFHNFYNTVRNNVYLSLLDKVHQEDSSIVVLTDTLAALRNLYGIYDLISPARGNMMLSSIKTNGKSNFGGAVENIQNIESIKDELVMDRARHVTLLNQFSTGTKINDLPLIQVITTATPPINAKGLTSYLTIIACALLGFFFSSLLVLIITYYRAIISVER
jgi:uncharacterized protein involved in exopolysaccharide biosynthesis